METMKFAAPVGCRNEVFTTVRLGKKWRTRIQGGCREVALQDNEGNAIGTAEITDVWFGPLSHIPGLFLEVIHDPVCRTWSGLFAVMRGMYPDGCDGDSEVTAIRLRYTGSLVKLATAEEAKTIADTSFGAKD